MPAMGLNPARVRQVQSRNPGRRIAALGRVAISVIGSDVQPLRYPTSSYFGKFDKTVCKYGDKNMQASNKMPQLFGASYSFHYFWGSNGLAGV